MRASLSFIAISAAALAATAPPMATPATAANAGLCGSSLVAGTSLCVWIMTMSEHRALVARANAGNRDAALKLAQFEDDRRDTRADASKWWRRAADLGECQAIRKLRDDAARIGNQRMAGYWRGQIGRYRCAPKVDRERMMMFWGA